jgi:hypothetical protein
MQTRFLLATVSLVGFLASFGQVAQGQQTVTWTAPTANCGLPNPINNLINIDATLMWGSTDQPIIANTVTFDIVKLYPAPNNTTYWIITTSTAVVSSLGPVAGYPNNSARFTAQIGTQGKMVNGDPSGTTYYIQVKYKDNGNTWWVNRQLIYAQP